MRCQVTLLGRNEMSTAWLKAQPKLGCASAPSNLRLPGWWWRWGAMLGNMSIDCLKRPHPDGDSRPHRVTCISGLTTGSGETSLGRSLAVGEDPSTPSPASGRAVLARTEADAGRAGGAVKTVEPRWVPQVIPRTRKKDVEQRNTWFVPTSGAAEKRRKSRPATWWNRDCWIWFSSSTCFSPRHGVWSRPFGEGPRGRDTTVDTRHLVGRPWDSSQSR